jgi:hypothetical protein
MSQGMSGGARRCSGGCGSYVYDDDGHCPRCGTAVNLSGPGLALPEGVAYLYASELGNGCAACNAVDGKEYRNVEAALVDYPGYGTYIGCTSERGCCGTLVAVSTSEAPPSIP